MRRIQENPLPLALRVRDRPPSGRPFAQARWNMMTTLIRPNLNVLRRLPTIHQVAETWGRLELKLETDDTRYWLTTEGASRKTSGMPINYVIDYVTVEK